MTLSKTATYGTATKALDVSGYFWIRNFFFLDTASIHTYLVNRAYESALHSGNVWIRYQSEIVWMLNRSRYFFIQWCKKMKPWSWVLYREYCIQDGNLVPSFSQGRARCKFCMLYNVCSVANIPRGVLDTGVNLDTCWIGVDRQIRFWWSFESTHPHQCGLGSNPGVDAIVGWVCHWFFPLFRGFSPGTLVFRPKNQHFQISNIQSGRYTHVSTSFWELLSAPWVNKLQHYVRMWKLLSPERKSCRFKYIRMCGTGYKDNHQRSELASWMDLVSLKA